MTDPLAPVANAADHWQHTRKTEAAARDNLVSTVTAANAAGASEYALAAAAGVSRQTIRAWLGKS